MSAKNITSGHPVEPGFQFSLANIRGKIAAYIDRVAAGDANAILHALILGNRSKISSDLRDAFNRAGISHLLAISGLHIGIVAVFSFFIFSRILSRFSCYCATHGPAKVPPSCPFGRCLPTAPWPACPLPLSVLW
ncbi:MAG: ComEC/Rec2 family competence protein [Desulfobacterales bacterium]